MGFAAILADWRSTGRDCEADGAETSLKIFREKHAQAYANLDDDWSIGDEVRKELLKRLLAVASDDEPVVSKCVQSFCWAHQLKGTVRNELNGTCFGHVEDRRNFEASLGSCEKEGDGLSRGGEDASALVEHVLRQDVAGQKSLLGSEHLSQRIMWSFYDSSDSSEPFHALPKCASELRRRLGLGHVPPRCELLVRSHHLRPDRDPKQAPRLPTPLDAELNEWFRLGGKTHPLSGADALDEVVHDKILGDQLKDRIETATE